MSKSSEAVKNWRRKTKERIIASMGGKCIGCGYSKFQEVFDLHHLDPSKKSFSFANIRANPSSWQKIVVELRKCVLLCANCHREVEAKHKHIENKQYFIESFADPEFFERTIVSRNQHTTFKKSYKEKTCDVCKNKFLPTSGKQKRCNVLCDIPK